MNQTLIDFLACIMENMTAKLQHYLIKTRVLCNQICITNLRLFPFILSGIIERVFIANKIRFRKYNESQETNIIISLFKINPYEYEITSFDEFVMEQLKQNTYKHSSKTSPITNYKKTGVYINFNIIDKSQFNSQLVNNGYRLS